MKRLLCAIGLMLTLAGCNQGPGKDTGTAREKPDPDTQEPIPATALERTDLLPGNPVVAVNYRGLKQVKDKDLKNLKDYEHLYRLDLGSTRITDAGLKEIKDCKGLGQGFATSLVYRDLMFTSCVRR